MHYCNLAPWELGFTKWSAAPTGGACILFNLTSWQFIIYVQQTIHHTWRTYHTLHTKRSPAATRAACSTKPGPRQFDSFIVQLAVDRKIHSNSPYTSIFYKIKAIESIDNNPVHTQIESFQCFKWDWKVFPPSLRDVRDSYLFWEEVEWFKG